MTKSVWTSLSRELEYLAPNLRGTLPIAEPIDIGAISLLAPWTSAKLEFSPREVEYLLSSVNEHLRNCLELRNRAQDLEVSAYNESIELQCQDAILRLLESQIALNCQNDAKTMANAASFTVEKTRTSPVPNFEYWNSLLSNQREQLVARRRYLESRKSIHEASGSGANFVERFAFLKSLFNVDLVEAYRRSVAAAKGLAEIYNFKKPLPPVKDVGYLNELVLWSREATYNLERQLSTRREAVVGFALHDGGGGQDVPSLSSKAAFDAAIDNGIFGFTLEASMFERHEFKAIDPRLRGIDLLAVRSDDKPSKDFWRVGIDLPVQTLDATFNDSAAMTVNLPFVATIAEATRTLGVASQRHINNATPIGAWHLRIGRKSVAGTTRDNTRLENFILLLRISYVG